MVRGSSGSFALEKRAQDDSVIGWARKGQATARTNNDEEQATARANAGILRCAQNDKQKGAAE
jgi:hypothetical protein